MLEELREKVCRANIMLQTRGLVQMTWGNASGISREKNLIVIKPSGVAYDALTPDKMVIVDMRGRKVEGNLNPSSDTPSHVHLYNNFPAIGGVVHTHSTWATVWCQAGRVDRMANLVGERCSCRGCRMVVRASGTSVDPQVTPQEQARHRV